MARNTTRQGADFELKVMHHLAGTKLDVYGPGYGYTCTRSSGSHGVVDVIAVHKGPLYGGARILLAIQCKLNIKRASLTPADRLAVQDWALCAGALPLVAFWAKDAKTKLMRIHYRQLTGPGAKDWAHWAPGEDD